MAKTTTPNKDPIHNVSFADIAEAFLQKTPNTNTQVMGGAMCDIISFKPLKILS